MALFPDQLTPTSSVQGCW